MRVDPGWALARGIRLGEPVALGDEDDPAEIPAAVLRTALFAAHEPHARGLRLEHAWIVGELDLDDLRFDAPLLFHHCGFSETVWLQRAHVGSLVLERCQIATSPEGAPAAHLEAMELNSSHSVGLYSTSVEGRLTLVRGRIDGALRLSAGSEIGGDADGDSLWSDGLTITGDLVIDGGSTFAGAARLAGAAIGGQLVVGGGANVGVNRHHNSLHANGLTTTGDLFIQGTGTTLTGAVQLIGAKIGAQLAIREGASIGRDLLRNSLNADGLTTTDDLFIQGTGTTLTGGVRLVGATVGGQLGIDRSAAVASNRDRWSLIAGGSSFSEVHIGVDLIGINLTNCTITGLLSMSRRSGQGEAGRFAWILLNGAVIERARLQLPASIGAIDLSNCRIRTLDDTPGFWGLDGTSPRTWTLTGLRIDQMPADPAFPSALRRRWLERARAPCGAKAADRETHRMVARAQVAVGEDDAAIETLRTMRRAHDPRWLRLLLKPIGQGYKPHWAAAGLLAVLVATFVLSFAGDHTGAFVATAELSPKDAKTEHLLRSQDCDEDHYPCLRPIVYAVDTMVPGLDLGEANRWSPATTRDRMPSWPDTLRYLLAFLRLLGWAFGALFVIGMLNVIVEQRRTE